MKKTKKPTAIPALPNARVGSIVGLLETLNEQGTKIDIYKLSESLGFKLNDLMPITEAAELLGFVKIESGDIELSDLGRKVVDGDENDKKSIFRLQMLGSVLLARRIRSELESTSDYRIGREVILEFLGSSFTPDESERQVLAIVDWARYAELFDYDPETDQFFLPEKAETA
ncbi:MAG TPA: AAA-associated domain-containing protein [Terriglobia bacterium]|nr:AAA-associated domain-containing protein [Terriglobia bacterium]